MRNVFKMLIVVAVCGTAFPAGRPEQMQQFILGFELLNENATLTDQQRGAAFKRLKQLTGIQAHEAVAFVQSFHDRPDAWRKLHDRMVKLAVLSFPVPKAPVPPDSITADSSGRGRVAPAPQRSQHNPKG